MDRAIIRYLILIICLASPVLSATRQVPSEYSTIQAAIDDSVNGDTVLVAPDTYTGEGNRDIDFKGKAITVRSEEGAETCVIDCQGSATDHHRGFYFHNAEDANSVMQGFTITNGYAHDRGGGIYCLLSSPCIINCIVIGNAARDGGGIACLASDAIVSCCVIQSNYAGEGGGIATADGHPRFTRCVISGNRSTYSGGGILAGGDHVFSNCLIHGNRGGDFGGGLCTGAGHGNTGILRNCIVWDNTAKWGSEIFIRNWGIMGTMRLRIVQSLVGTDDDDVLDPDNRIDGQWLKADPMFNQPGHWDPNGTLDNLWDDFWVEGDYHLKSQAGRWNPTKQNWVKDDVTSPCIDAGDLATPIGDEPFPNGGRINMGAYGGTAEASKSYFGEPPCETIIAGDINGDCKVDFVDLELMAIHWLADNSP